MPPSNVEEVLPATPSDKPPNTNVFGGVDITPQRTLFGKSISAVGTPKQVYRAFGMHRDVSNHVKRSWTHTLTSPVEEMSTRNRSRVLAMATPVVKTMFRAFAGEYWSSLLYYIANNVLLHERASKRSNRTDRSRMYRDQVYRQTLIRSQLVKNVVDAFNNIDGNDRHARDERRRILSTIALDFPFKVIRTLGWKIPDVGKFQGRHLTRHMFRDARAHAGAFTPGGHPICLQHVQSVTISAAKIADVFTFLMQSDHAQKLASGSNDLVLSTGETFHIPPVARKFLRTHLWVNFARKHTDENGNYNGGISRSDFLEIAKTATSEQEKCYSALDQIKVRCGSENFEAGIRLTQDICALSPTTFTGYEENLKTLMKQHINHCKTVLPTHLSTTSKCANHCLTHLFGGQGAKFCNECVDCGGHPERCKDCDAGKVIISMMQGMIDKLLELGTFTADTIEDLQWRLNK